MSIKEIVIDGKSYEFELLSEDGKKQVLNVQIVESEIRRLNAQLAIAQTARNAYIKELRASISKTT
jgi:hypothetical protein